MKRINQGEFIGDYYRKVVQFSKAVIWKERCISLNPQVIKAIYARNTRLIVFEDYGKNERWVIKVADFLKNASIKKIGQEEQYYCHIDFFNKMPIVKKEVFVRKEKITKEDVNLKLF